MSALHPATSTIPIVFAVLSNPVGQGFISNLAHPGGKGPPRRHHDPRGLPSRPACCRTRGPALGSDRVQNG
jgi:hypothetical protein